MQDSGRYEAASPKDVGARLKLFRRSRGMKQLEIASVLGTSQNMVSQYETGKRRFGIAQALKLINRYKDLTLDWLYLGRGPGPRAMGGDHLRQTEDAIEELRAGHARLEHDQNDMWREINLLKSLVVQQHQGKVSGDGLAGLRRRLDREKVSAARF